MNKRFQNILARLLYVIPLIVFILVFIFNVDDMKLVGSYGIRYYLVFSFPIIVFGYQSIRKSVIGWILVMILYLVFLAHWIKVLIEIHYLVSVIYSIDHYIFCWSFLLVYLVIGWIYFKFRPKKPII